MKHSSIIAASFGAILIIVIASVIVYRFFITPKFSITTQLIIMSIDDIEPSIENHEINKDGTLNKKAVLGASGIDLLTSLYQESSIVIVTSSVASYLMRYLHEVSSNPFRLNPELTIKPENWIKKKVTDYLYILIPKNYSSTRKNYVHFSNTHHQNYTEEELTIGISFANKEDISDNDFMSPTYHKGNTAYPQKVETDVIGSSELDIAVSWTSSHVIEQLPSIFIPLHAYTDREYAPRSAILLYGHGSKYNSIDDRITDLLNLKKNYPNDEKFHGEIDSEVHELQQKKTEGQTIYSAGVIGGLRRNDYGKLIDFFNNNMSVELLFARTCFGSEINLEAALHIITPEKNITIDPVFTLISGAISSAVALAGYRVDVDKETRSLGFPLYEKFFNTLNTTTSNDDKRLFDALQYIYFFYKKYQSYNNIPVIKYPHTPWRPLAIPHVLLTLDDTLTKNIYTTFDISPYFSEKKQPPTQKSSTPPEIEHFFAYKFPYPNIIFLTKEDMPFELVLSGTSKIELPAFISQIPGEATHHFKKINAATFTLSLVLESFFKIEGLWENKTFVIDELIVKNDLTILPYDLGKALSLYHVILQNKFDPKTRTTTKSVFFETPDKKEWAALDITMDNPVGFAIQPEKQSGRIKKILSALPGGLEKYYREIPKKEDSHETKN